MAAYNDPFVKIAMAIKKVAQSTYERMGIRDQSNATSHE